MSFSSRDLSEYAEYSGSVRWLILIALMLGTLMQVIDTSIVNVAIPQMMGNLGATVDQIGWVSTGYIISNVIVLPLTGWLASTFGRKNYLTASIIMFTVASFLCGISWNLTSLVIFRILQGASGAALISTSQATLMEVFPPQQIGMVQSIYGLGIMVGPTIGPTLGGWITDNYNWPWIFFVNVPIGIIAAFMTYAFIHDSKHARATSGIDFVGIGLLAIGLGALQTVLEKGNREGWFQSSFITLLAISAFVCLTVFLIWELRIKHPAVNLRVLKNRNLAAGSLFGTVLGFGLFGGVFILPIFLQNFQHYTAMQTGLILLPGAIATAITMPIVGKLTSKVYSPLLVGIGSVVFIISMFMLSTLTSSTSTSQLFWPLVMRGASMGFLFAPLSLASLYGLHSKDLADGSGLFNLFRQIGGSFGIALLSTLLDHRTALHRTTLVENINIYNPAAMQRLQALQAGFISKGFSPLIAKQQALSIVDKIVQGQAAILAFEDIFLFVAVFFILTTPLLFFFRKPKRKAAVSPHMVSE